MSQPTFEEWWASGERWWAFSKEECARSAFAAAIASQQAEIERLREALKLHPHGYGMVSETCPCCQALKESKIAVIRWPPVS